MNNPQHTMKSIALALLAGGLLLAGAATLIPWSSVSEANAIGYKSLCPFAPFSTLICLMGANILMTLRKRIAVPTEEPPCQK